MNGGLSFFVALRGGELSAGGSECRRKINDLFLHFFFYGTNQHKQDANKQTRLFLVDWEPNEGLDLGFSR